MSVRYIFGTLLDEHLPVAGRTSRATRSRDRGDASKFDFPWLDRAIPKDEPIAEPEAPPEPPPPTYSEAELAAAIEQAHADGVAAGEAAANAAWTAEQSTRLTAAQTDIAARLIGAQEQFDQLLTDQARLGRDLGLALARAIVPEALARQPLADIEAMLQAIVARLTAEPRLELRLPPALVAAGEAALAAIAAQSDYRGELTVVADDKLGPADATLAWAHGTAERVLDQVEADVHRLAQLWLGDGAALPQPDTSPSPSPEPAPDADLGSEGQADS